MSPLAEPQPETVPDEILVLLIHRGEGTPKRRVALDRFPLTIGREPGVDVLLDDERVSRRHARIERRGPEIRIIDLGSRNGIYVNGIATRDALVEAGVRLRIGELYLDCKRINLGRLSEPDATELV